MQNLGCTNWHFEAAEAQRTNLSSHASRHEPELVGSTLMASIRLLLRNIG